MRRILLAAVLGGAAGAPWEGEAWPSLDSIANARRLYRTGETGVPECWLATTLLDECPDEWPAPEYTMAHDEGETWYPAEAHTLTYKMEAPGVNVLEDANGDGIYHANIHACPVGVGLCQPYMDTTVAGLITQTSVVSGAFGEVFSQDIQLPDVGVWVLIAHIRFDVGDADDNRTRADAARAIYVTVEDASVCPPGTYKLDYVCEPCEPGTYSDQNNSAACLPCLYGAAAPASGATACDDCAAGKFAAARGATSSNTSGVATAADWCKPCAAGYASASAASVLCEPCESGATSEAGSPTCDLCTAGYFLDGDDCRPCSDVDGVEDDLCPVGTTLETLTLQDGRWRATDTSTKTERCDHARDCAGGRPGGGDARRGVPKLFVALKPRGSGTLPPPHQGPKVRALRGGLRRRGDGRLDARLRAVLDGLDADASRVGRRDRRRRLRSGRGPVLEPRRVQRLRLQRLQAHPRHFCRIQGDQGGHLRRRDERRREYVARTASCGHDDSREFLSSRNTLRRSRLGKLWNRVRTKLKIILTLYQLLSVMEFNLNVRYPRLYDEIMGIIGRVVHINLARAFPLQCDFEQFGAEQELWLATLWPLLAIGVVWGAHLFHVKSRASDASAHHETPIAFSLALLYVVFPSVSTKIFHSFICTTFDYDSGDKYEHVMEIDYGVSCRSAEYARIRIYAAIFSMIYPAVPFLFFVLLFRVRRHLNPLPYPTPEARAEGLKQFVDCEVAARGHVPGRQLLGELESALLLKQQQLRDEFTDTLPYQLLYREFEPEYWYWDTVDGVRRLLLSAAIAVFERGTSLQSAVGFFVSFVYACLCSSRNPYVDPEDDWLARCSTQIIVLVYFVTVARGADMSDESDATRDLYRKLLFLFGVVAPLCLIVNIVGHMALHDSDIQLEALLERERRGLDWVKKHAPRAPRKSAVMRFVSDLGLPTTLAPAYIREDHKDRRCEVEAEPALTIVFDEEDAKDELEARRASFESDRDDDDEQVQAGTFSCGAFSCTDDDGS